MIALVLSLSILLAGCATGAASSPSSAPTTTSEFTHAQVLGWVTPTLANGLSLVGTAPPGATASQLATSSQPLRTAASVALNELREVSWPGPVKRDEASLVKALMRLENLTGSTPGPAYLAQLDHDAQAARTALQALTAEVNR
jgi:hypothetical protein